jgi:peptide/nickel transport system substrate-binding protein
VAKDPSTRGYWFATTGGIVSLTVNTTKKPFDDVNVRKAISMGINRDQIVKVAVFGYVKPADVTGVAEGFPQLKVSDPSKLGDWTNYNVAKANQMLDAAGLKKGGDGIRTLPDGTKMSFKLNVSAGFAIHVSAAQIVAQNLKAIGIDATLQQLDAPGWQDRLQKGNFDMSMALPLSTNFYASYRAMMSETTSAPVGTDALGGNYGRYVSQKGDQLLNQFATTVDPAQQKQVAQQLQQVFADEAPLIPLYLSPLWYEYNTTRFTGFPTKDNPYVVGSFGQVVGSAEALIVMTSIKPK